MRSEILTLALIVGGFNWAFRYLPIRADLLRLGGAKGGALARFIAATGPAAIATLCLASSLPLLQAGPGLAFAGGGACVLAVFAWRRSVVLASFAGALAYGLIGAVLGG